MSVLLYDHIVKTLNKLQLDKAVDKALFSDNYQVNLTGRRHVLSSTM